MTALYIHFPFCIAKCGYCSFVSIADGSRFFKPYAAALKKELNNLRAVPGNTQGITPELQTLFLGGGTPTSLPRELLLDCIAHIFSIFPFASDAELSIECNPGSVDEEYLKLLRQAGINRLSIGVQSMVDGELRALGRVHSREDAYKTYCAARRAGFTNINLDIMYGLPAQTPPSWQQSLEHILEWEPEHLSIYQLTIEEGTPFWAAHKRRQFELPGEDYIEAMDELTAELCSKAGHEQYEISNYARSGYRCSHNINYWENGSYLAAGASAVSCVQGRRERREGDVATYIRMISETGSAIVDTEILDAEASFRETVIMGLRMVEGVDLGALHHRYGCSVYDVYGSTLQRLLELGVLELEPDATVRAENHGRLRLSRKGWPLANTVMAELV